MKTRLKHRTTAMGAVVLLALSLVAALAGTLAAPRAARAAEIGSVANLTDVAARGGGYDNLLSPDSGYTPEKGGFNSDIGLSATLTIAHDPSTPLKAGDTFFFGLVPDDSFASKFWYVYNSDKAEFRTVLDDETDEEIATIAWSDSNTLTLTFTEAAEDKSEVRCVFSSIPFTRSARYIYEWFANNGDSDRIHETPEGRRYVDVTYHLTVNGQKTDQQMTLRALSPRVRRPGAPT